MRGAKESHSAEEAAGDANAMQPITLRQDGGIAVPFYHEGTGVVVSCAGDKGSIKVCAAVRPG